MKTNWVLTGRVVSGVQQAAYFTQLDWVQRQCLEKLGFKPYPGTLNLEIAVEDLAILAEIQRIEGIKLISPDPAFCDARTLPVSMGNFPAALVIPDEQVRVHRPNIIEVIAHLRLKDALDIEDGDAVTLFVHHPNQGV